MNKKGNVLDFLPIMIILFIAGIFLVISLFIVLKVSNLGLFTDYPDAQQAINYSRDSLINMDSMMLFLLVGLSLFVLLSSYFVNSHPAFFFISVFLLAIIVFISGTISNSYETFNTDSIINESSSNFPRLALIMNNLPIYLVAMGFLTLIVAYSGYRGSQ